MTLATQTAPRVSIIMIFLNAEQFITEAIASVLAQTVSDWELLLVDDGSSDRSTDVALTYSRSDPTRIRYVEHPQHQNLGMSAARNAGLRVAQGDYVAFLDADDVYEPGRLERHLQILQDNPRVAMVQSCLTYWRSWQIESASQIDDTRDFPPPVALNTALPPPILLALLLQTDGATVPGICSVTVRRNLLEKLGGFEDSFRGTYEDQVLLAKVYLASAVYVIDACLARYRQHRTSNLHMSQTLSEYTPGRPHAARAKYLRWLEGYLCAQPNVNALVWQSLQRALWPYRHPWLWRIRSAPQAALRLIRLGMQRLLPTSVSGPIVRWYGDRKNAAALIRAARASDRISQLTEKSANDGPETK